MSEKADPKRIGEASYYLFRELSSLSLLPRSCLLPGFVSLNSLRVKNAKSPPQYDGREKNSVGGGSFFVVVVIGVSFLAGQQRGSLPTSP